MAVIQEAWAGGVSTRRVDEPVQAMGLSGISKSTVSELCRDIDERVQAFLNRPIEGEWPYLWLDAVVVCVKFSKIPDRLAGPVSWFDREPFLRPDHLFSQASSAAAVKDRAAGRSTAERPRAAPQASLRAASAMPRWGVGARGLMPPA